MFWAEPRAISMQETLAIDTGSNAGRYTIWRPRLRDSTSITVFVGQWMIEGALPPAFYVHWSQNSRVPGTQIATRAYRCMNVTKQPNETSLTL